MDFLLPQQKLTILKSDDFELKDKDKMLNLKYDEYIVVLFYDNGNQSKKLISEWIHMSKHTFIYNFAICDLMQNQLLMDKIIENNNNKNNSSWINLDDIPFIIIYKNNKPISQYKGPDDEISIMHHLAFICNNKEK